MLTQIEGFDATASRPSGFSGGLELGTSAKGAGQLRRERMSCIFSLPGGKRLDGWAALFLVTTVLTRDRVLFSVPQVFAVARGRHRVAGSAGDCHLCALRQATRRRLAPTGSEPPFLAAQLVCMAVFVVLGIGAAIEFRNEAVRTD